ncbi:MAG: hypothetical protein ACP5NA_06925 [Candidatus Acidulodesulfobacterium sp.]
MKKLFIYLTAALAVLGFGFASIANAGTVTIAGNTNLTIGGFILGYYGESSNQNLVSSMANNPGIINTQTNNSTNFSGTLAFTRLWLNLDNKPEGLTGYISADFNGGGVQGLTQGIRLRRAYLIKSFKANGLSPWIEIGQDYTLGQPVGFSFSAYQNAGLAGDEASVPIWVPQIMAGVKFASGNATFNPQIGLIDLQGESGSDNYTELMSNAGDSDVYDISPSVPGFGVKLPVTFKTGLGAPASFYGAFQGQQINVSYGFSKNNALKKSEFGWAASGGVTIPVSYVTFMGDIQYTSGMTGLNTVLGQENLGSYTPESYWSENGNNVNATKAVQWDAQAKINLEQFGAPLAIAGGYSKVSFSNYNDALGLNLNNTYSAWSAYNDSNNVAPVRESGSIFANIGWNVTKSVMLGLEWDNNLTSYAVDPDASFHSNSFYMIGMYSF